MAKTKRELMQKQSFSFKANAINESKRTIEFIGTTEAKDRYKEVLTLKGWRMKDYKNNNVFLWAHNYADPAIGKTVRLKMKKGVGWLFLVEFASREVYPFADTIFKLYQGGFMRAVSVGYIVHKIEYDEDEKQLYITDKELLELSAVPVPGNQEALINDGKDITKAINLKSAVGTGCINEQEAGEFALLCKQYYNKIENISTGKELDPDVEYDNGFDLTVDEIDGDDLDEKHKIKPTAMSQEATPQEEPVQEEDEYVDPELKDFQEEAKKIKSIYDENTMFSENAVNDNAVSDEDVNNIKSLTHDLKKAFKN